MLKKLSSIIIITLMLFITASAEKPKEEYSIQVGIYKDFNKALEIQERIDPLGYETYYIEESPGEYKVRFGEFPSKAEAESVAQDFYIKGVISSYTVVESLWILVEPEIEYAPGDPAGWDDGNDYGIEKFTVEKEPATPKVQPKTPPLADKQPTVKTVLSAKRDKVVNTAKKYLGIPYKWGGTSPNTGFDCSGLTSYTYMKNGFKIPRRSAHQYRVGDEVKKPTLKKGDLVFFATGKAWAITHVGIYVGNGKFIHAPRTGRNISIESMNNSYYKKRFYGAKRLI